MSVQTEKFIRKVRPVEAVKVTEDNLSAVAGWCGGLVVPAGTIGDSKETYIHVPVRNPRRDSDSQAFVGMWIVKEDFRNCRVVTNKQFRNSYDQLEKAKAPAPKPSAMPAKKKVAEPAESGPTQVGAVEVVPGTPADPGSSLTTGTKERHVNRDASSGEFVSDEVAAANPATTVTETIEDVVADADQVAAEAAEWAALEAEEAANNQKESNVNENEMSGAESVEPGDVVADELSDAGDLAATDEEIDEAVGVVPGDMIDPEQPEEDEDGTVQLGAPLESSEVETGTPELCGQCGSQVVSGVCSKDIEHDVNGQASTDDQTAPRILPGD